jgi:anti-sigma factor RsiW
MVCSKCRKLYTAYRDGELRDALRKDVEDHIESCSACRSLYLDLDRIVDASASLSEFKASERTAGKVLALIRSSETVLTPEVPFRRWLAPRLAYGALAMVVAGMAAFLVFHSEMGNRQALSVASAGTKERIYSLGPHVEASEIVDTKPDYSLAHSAGPEEPVYSLPTRSVYARPASY